MTDTTGPIQVVIQTIGIRHPDAITKISSGLYYDLSRQLRNPHNDPAMRYRNGLDPDVADHVLGTPGAMETVERIAEAAKAILAAYADRRQRLVHVTVACMGGRHRSVAIAEAAATYLRTAGFGVETDHRHIDLPVIEDQT